MKLRSTAALTASLTFSRTTPITSAFLQGSLNKSMSSTSLSAASPLASLELDNSWPRTLSSETPENFAKSLQTEGLTDNSNDDDDANNNINRTKRPVFNGHFVLVKPSGLTDPQRLLVSEDVALNWLKLSKEQVDSEDFVQWVAGNLVLDETWATPYALSIMGTRYTSNCPYGTGDGYGDGRAISIAELNGYELQLKGAGKTPFARGADGRAVLRSSIREYLASEAMHYLGIDTTRALSLVKSASDTVNRPWYSDDAVLSIPSVDDVRLAQYPLEKRKQIIQQLKATQKADPNVMISESCAITCRVATSFVRIGHLDLFARRAEAASVKAAMDMNSKSSGRFATSTLEWKELEELIWHACFREYKKEAYDPYFEKKDVAAAGDQLLLAASHKIADMVTGWVRVGFAQGNFNADNCLIGGKTMDYGPFGWLEEFTPLFAKWTGSGQHFGFLNQPAAGFANYQVLVESVVPVIAAAQGLDGPDKLVEEYMEKAQAVFTNAMNASIRRKMGLPADADAADDLWESLQTMMRDSPTDWTLLWRQLTYVVRDHDDLSSEDYEGMMRTLEGGDDVSKTPSCPFYMELSAEARREWIAWIQEWRNMVRSTGQEASTISETMRMANPKYVLREWMLVDAYSNAAQGDYTVLKELNELIQRPYEEGSSAETAAYYRRAPDSASARGGTAFMS